MPNHYTTVAICSPGHDFDCEAFNAEHSKTCLCEAVLPMPQHVRDTPATHYRDGTTERERRGAETDWYEWACENWGTKWGTYDSEAFELGGDSSPIAIKFQSAWGPPKILPAIGDWLKQRFGFERVEFVGFNPYDDSTRLLNQGAEVRT